MKTGCQRVFALVTMCVFVFTGCGLFGGTPKLPALTPAQTALVNNAKTRCPAVEGNDTKLSFVGKPSIGGKKQGIIESSGGSSSLGDALILKGMFDQRLCLLEELASGAEKDGLVLLHEKYMTDISTAVRAWPVYDASQYDKLVRALTTQRDAHLLDVTSRFSAAKHQINDNMLITAIPYYDFLHLKQFDFSMYADKDATLKGVDIANSAGKICLSKDDFSVAVRPALDQTRAIVIGLGMGKYGEAQALRLMLTQIYEAGAQRLWEARQANGASAPVKCALPDTPAPAQAAGAAAKPVGADSDQAQPAQPGATPGVATPTPASTSMPAAPASAAPAPAAPGTTPPAVDKQPGK